MATINVEKIAETANVLGKVFNQDFRNSMEECASILRTVDSNSVTEKAMQAMGKAEAVYNDEAVPVLSNIQKVLVEDVPELNNKLNSLAVSTVKEHSTDTKVEELDIDQIPVC